MRFVVRVRFGSHLYGTNVETSDTDYKSVYMPDAEDIVLQRVKDTINTTTKQDPNGKNSAKDVDTETYSLQEFMRLLTEGQTVAIDMLFAGNDMLLETSETWDKIQFFKDNFLHKGASAFIGYCRVQANKYGIKGSRVAAMRHAVETLGGLVKDHPHDSLEDHMDVITGMELTQPKAAGSGDKFINFVTIPGKLGQELHVEVCNRKVPVKAKVKYTYDIYKKVLDKYGHRALMAEKNLGIDWKALMHAVRVIEEGKELLSTGKVTFPRPERELLLKIRRGKLPYNEVADIIEKGFHELILISERSTLREEPDYKLADNLVMHEYSKVIVEEFS